MIPGGSNDERLTDTYAYISQPLVVAAFMVQLHLYHGQSTSAVTPLSRACRFLVAATTGS